MSVPKPGDWARFYRNAEMVIGVVQYVIPANSSQHRWTVQTDKGEVWETSILEIRRSTGESA